MVVFLPGGGSKAASDQDSVFYSNTVDEDGAVKLSVGSASDSGPSVRVDFDALPAGRQLAVPAAAVDGDNSFGDLGAVSVGLGSRRKTCHFCTRPWTVERTMVLADLSAAQMFGAVGRQVRGITTDLALLLSRLRCRGGRLTSISFSEK